MSNQGSVIHFRGVFSITIFLVANEVLLQRVRFCTVAASEAQITPGFMVNLDMLLELSLFCGSFPRTVIRVIWALLRFGVCLQVLSKTLLAAGPWKNMNRWANFNSAAVYSF
jgi:hypothetical protein